MSYVFGVPGWAQGGLPPVETLKAKGQLNEFVWRPAEQAASARPDPMLRSLILAASLLALAACGPAGHTGGGKASTPSSTSAPAVVTRQAADGAVDRFTPYEGGPLALGEFSVGPVMAQTEFSLDAIKPRFPKAKVEGMFLGDAVRSALMGITVEQGGGVDRASMAIPARPRSATSASPAARPRGRAARPWA